MHRGSPVSTLNADSETPEPRVSDTWSRTLVTEPFHRPTPDTVESDHNSGVHPSVGRWCDSETGVSSEFLHRPSRPVGIRHTSPGLPPTARTTWHYSHTQKTVRVSEAFAGTGGDDESGTGSHSDKNRTPRASRTPVSSHTVGQQGTFYPKRLVGRDGQPGPTPHPPPSTTSAGTEKHRTGSTSRCTGIPFLSTRHTSTTDHCFGCARSPSRKSRGRRCSASSSTYCWPTHAPPECPQEDPGPCRRGVGWHQVWYPGGSDEHVPSPAVPMDVGEARGRSARDQENCSKKYQPESGTPGERK